MPLRMRVRAVSAPSPFADSCWIIPLWTGRGRPWRSPNRWALNEQGNVMPAKAGIQRYEENWIPSYAGMTPEGGGIHDRQTGLGRALFRRFRDRRYLPLPYRAHGDGSGQYLVHAPH